MSDKTIKLFSLCFVLFIDAISSGIIIPILPELFLNSSTGIMANHTHLRDLFYSLSIAVFPFCSLFSMPLFGCLSDKYGRKKFLLIGLTGIFFSYLIGAISIYYQDIYLFLISRLISGISVGTYTISNAMIADITDSLKEKMLAFRWPTIAYLFGFMLGPILGSVSTLFNSSHSLYIPFFIGSIISSLNIFLVLIFISDTAKSPNKISVSFNVRDEIRNYINIIRASKLKYVALSYAALQLCTGLFIQSLNIRLAVQFNFKPEKIGFFFFIVSIAIILNAFILQKRIFKKFSSSRIIKYSLSAVLTCFLLQLFLSHSQNSSAQTIELTLCVLTYVFINLCAPLFTSIFSINTDENEQGKVMAFSGQLYSIAWLISGLVIGFLVFDNIGAILTICTICLLASLGFISKYFYQSKTLGSMDSHTSKYSLS